MNSVKRDIIVVGASAGGIEAITALVAGLPADLDAAVLIVLHMGPTFPRVLAQRLSTVGPLSVADAVDGETLRPNRVYLCVPDRHLLIEGDTAKLSFGPKENHSRPSVDALFRSAAYYHGPRVIGVVLTGQLDDGTAGLWAIKDRGGLAVIQDPVEALYRSMPESARRQVPIDYTLRTAEMGAALRLLTREVIVVNSKEPAPERLRIETSIALGKSALDGGVQALGEPSLYTCPDCHGTLLSIREGSTTRFRCHTGHAYNSRSLVAYSLAESEKSLWMALVKLEEHEMLVRQLGADDVEGAQQAERVRGLRLRLRALLEDPSLRAVPELERL